MAQKYSRIVLMVRKTTEDIIGVLKDALVWLKKLEVSVFWEEETAKLVNELDNLEVLPWLKISDRDLVITFGGDGCFLSGARLVLPTRAAILGINCGRSFGFLTDIDVNNFDELLEVIKGNGVEENRSVLSINTREQQFSVINEIAIFSSIDKKGIFSCLLRVDDQQLINYRVDGLIIATPTGSTGHALSAGGTILSPQMSAIEVVPVLSQHLGMRPLILPEETSLEFLLDNRGICRDYSIVLDGYEQRMLAEPIFIKMASLKLRCVHHKNYNFFKVINNKLRWQWDFS